MAIRDWFGRRQAAPQIEQRASLENPLVPISSADVVRYFGLTPSLAGVSVTTETALGLPAVWGAVNFLSGTLAGLSLDVFRRTADGHEPVKGGLQPILHDAVNDDLTSFKWRKYIFDRLFTEGRCYTYIERSGNGKVANLFPFDPTKTRVQRRDGALVYTYKEGRKETVYKASEIIDLSFYSMPDGMSSKSPLQACADALGQALSVQRYGAQFFQNGGIPQVVITGPFTSPGGLQRSSEEIKTALQNNIQQGKPYLALPDGHKIDKVGINPSDGQMVEVQNFMVQQVARIYSLPPIFVQDLSNGTFANSEQQDLHLVKHTLKRWAEDFEQELALKLLGRGSSQFIELDFDDLLRGDYKTRMEGNAQAVQNGIMTPNEVRQRENLPAAENGNDLMGQAQLVPLGTGMKQGVNNNAA